MVKFSNKPSYNYMVNEKSREEISKKTKKG